MVVGDFSSVDGVKVLNELLRDRTYITGYQPSQDDVAVYTALKKAPGSDNPYALRWYKHITSYSAKERSAFPKGDGVKPVKEGGEKTAKQEEDDDVDLFASDEEEDAEAERIKEERLKAYNEKKSKKPALIAKSSIILDVKPWDDETDMKEMETKVRSIAMDGLLWGTSKLLPVGYGINKLHIMCVVEDDKVSVDQLVEDIEAFEDVVQSVDIAAFNKI